MLQMVPSGAAILTIAVGLSTGTETARELTFEERVEAQRAIERVYYSHQVGTSRPFEEAVPGSMIEARVVRSLKESAALEIIWKSHLTPEAIRRESLRIVGRTRLPERLEEIHEALGGDPYLIQECFVRPVLARRLARGFFAGDRRIHAGPWREMETLHRRVEEDPAFAASPHPMRRVIELVVGDADPAVPRGTERVGGIADPVGLVAAAARTDRDLPGREAPFRRGVSHDELETWRARIPRDAGLPGPIEETESRLSFGVLLAEGPGWIRIVSYSVEKRTWDDWWAEVGETLQPDLRGVADPPASQGQPSGRGAAWSSGEAWMIRAWISRPEASTLHQWAHGCPPLWRRLRQPDGGPAPSGPATR